MYRKISDGWMKHWDFELIDVIMLEISLFISYFFRHHNSAFLFKSMYLRMGILLIVLNFATVLFSQNYKNIVQRLWYQELRAVFVQVTTVNLLLLLYEYIIQECKKEIANVQTGIFGADMKISLVNDGPFTIVLDSDDLAI